MAKYYSSITSEQKCLIEEAKLFFLASTHLELSEGPDGQGAVNLSPKGNVPLTILDENTVAYLDYHGSANETARHIEGRGPMTIMLMSLDDEDAAVVRLFGHGRIESLETSPLAERLLARCEKPKGLRQIVVMDVDRTSTSCGYGVPVYRYVADREVAQRGRRFKEFEKDLAAEPEPPTDD